MAVKNICFLYVPKLMGTKQQKFFGVNETLNLGFINVD